MNPVLAQIHALVEPIMVHAEADGVEEICINRPGEIFVRQDGRFTRHEEPELDFEQLLDITILTAALGKKDATEREPLLFTDMPMPGGPPLRLMAVQPPAVEGGLISLTLRKPGDAIHTIDEVPMRYKTGRWNRWRRRNEQRDHGPMLDLYDSGDIEAFLREAVLRRYNVLLCGPTGSGKTTMGVSLLSLIPETERLVTVENTREYRLVQRNKVHLLYHQGEGGYANISVADLLVATMRMRPDRVLLQELLDSEAAATYVQSIVSGHPGSFSTIHGRDAAQAFKRLFGLIKGSDIGRDQDSTWILDLLSSAVDIIVPFENHGTDYEIAEVWFGADRARHGETAADLLKDI